MVVLVIIYITSLHFTTSLLFVSIFGVHAMTDGVSPPVAVQSDDLSDTHAAPASHCPPSAASTSAGRNSSGIFSTLNHVGFSLFYRSMFAATHSRTWG